MKFWNLVRRFFKRPCPHVSSITDVEVDDDGLVVMAQTHCARCHALIPTYGPTVSGIVRVYQAQRRFRDFDMSLERITSLRRLYDETGVTLKRRS